MLIRPWLKSDNQSVEKIERECFSDPWNISMIESTTSLAGFIGYVVEDNGEIVGYIGSSYIFEDGEILLVAVKGDYRRKGYAEKLILTLFETLKNLNVEHIFLEVRKSNLPAKKCYEKCGFSVIGERKRYYSDGEDALIMEKRI